MCKSIEKKNYYNNLDLKVFEDNKKFWKRVKPLFADKRTLFDRNIVIMEDKNIFSENAEVAEKLIEAVQSLEIEPFVLEAVISVCEGDIEIFIKQYEQHRCILKIKEYVTLGCKFTLSHKIYIIPQDVHERIPELETSIENDIPDKILIGSNEIVSNYLADIYNNSKNRNYPSSLKLDTITPINKTKLY